MSLNSEQKLFSVLTFIFISFVIFGIAMIVKESKKDKVSGGKITGWIFEILFSIAFVIYALSYLIESS
jgi:hypothetical protein